MSVDPVIVLALRSALALLLGAAAVQKARDFTYFVAVIRDYRVAPARAARLLAAGALVLEAAIAAALLTPAAGQLGAVAASLLLAAYSGAIAVNLARGRREIDCGCFGPAGRQTLSGWLVVRNVVLVATALVAASPLRPRSFVWLDAVSGAGALLALSLLWEAMNGLLPRAVHSSLGRRRYT